MTSPKSIPPYPLAWPDNQPRAARRENSRFDTTRAKAIANVERSLRLFAEQSGKRISGVQITSNVAGLSPGQPDDTGVAVWFEWDGKPLCIAVDRYRKVENNLQAIHHVLEARRTELRHAGIEMTRTAFRGFTALPPPPNNAIALPGGHAWHDVLGLDPSATADQIVAEYRRKCRAHGGATAELNRARDEGLRATGDVK